MERLVDPLTTIDAKLWADEFMKVNARLGEPKFDHAMMLGWFANAIMQGYDEGQRRAKADAQATMEALQRERDEAIEDRYMLIPESGDTPVTWEEAYNDAQAALDAAREKAKNDATAYRKLSEQWNATDLELSQLQALVRVAKAEVWKEAAVKYALWVGEDSEVPADPHLDGYERFEDYCHDRAALDASDERRKNDTRRTRRKISEAW